MRLFDLPIKSVLPDVADALSFNRPVVLCAPPGTGKTLLVAPSLLDAPWLEGKKIILLEPRRLAARMAASMMSKVVEDKVGGIVGYQVRLEKVTSARTRIEILTEGLLSRRIISDPELSDVGLIIFDEFHERSINADFAIALTRDLRSVLRPDLRLVVMSATIDAGAIAGELGEETAIIRAEARQYPIETRFLASTPAFSAIDEVVATGIFKALRETTGGILAFLPGEREIRYTHARLLKEISDDSIDIYPLYSALSKEEQSAAVESNAEGRRKVVLATSIAESSLTIQGISVVVDSGLMRRQSFSQNTGMSHLVTTRLSRDRADQRRGRAGRLGPGICYRLWDEATDRALRPDSVPEILDADLASLRLLAAMWGATKIGDLPWITAPAQAQWDSAGDLLYYLEALGKDRKITKKGRNLLAISAHPRLAHMVEKAGEYGARGRAAYLAAIVEELSTEPRLQYMDDAGRLLRQVEGESTDYGDVRLPQEWVKRVRLLAKMWMRGNCDNAKGNISVGRLLSWAFPDRIGKNRDNQGSFKLVQGHGARVNPESSLFGENLIVAAVVQDRDGDGIVRVGAPIEISEIEEDFSEQFEEIEKVVWSKKLDRILATKEVVFGALAMATKPLANPSMGEIAWALRQGIESHGLESMGWSKEAASLRNRVVYLHKTMAEDGWPDLSDASLLDNLELFLGPFLQGATKWDEIKRIDLYSPLEAYIGYRTREVDKLAPTHLLLPCGHRARINYEPGDEPTASAKLQDFFGLNETPKIANGRISPKIVMLSPAMRPIAITDNLASFWKTGYPIIRKELRGRYPKHSWPENPC